jgi:hypothetical protein
VEMRACSAPAAGSRAWYASTWRQMVRSFSTAPSVSRKMHGIPAKQQQHGVLRLEVAHKTLPAAADMRPADGTVHVRNDALWNPV